MKFLVSPRPGDSSMSIRQNVQKRADVSDVATCNPIEKDRGASLDQNRVLSGVLSSRPPTKRHGERNPGFGFAFLESRLEFPGAIPGDVMVIQTPVPRAMYREGWEVSTQTKESELIGAKHTV
jgi:hypothetical protein